MSYMYIKLAFEINITHLIDYLFIKYTNVILLFLLKLLLQM